MISRWPGARPAACIQALRIVGQSGNSSFIDKASRALSSPPRSSHKGREVPLREMRIPSLPSSSRNWRRIARRVSASDPGFPRRGSRYRINAGAGKNSATSAFLASPLLSPALERRLSAGSEIQSRMRGLSWCHDRFDQLRTRPAMVQRFCGRLLICGRILGTDSRSLIAA